MGNSVSFGSLPCTCLSNRKIQPISDEAVQVVENGHTSAGVSDPHANNGNGNAAKKEGPASSAYINSASIGSPVLASNARETFPMCLLLIGLDGAGKTSFLQWAIQKYPSTVLKGHGRRGSQSREAADYSDPKPTMGFSKEEFRYKRHSVVLHDLGGGKSIRGIWRNYFAEAHGIVLLVDSSTAPGNSKLQELDAVIDNLIASGDSSLQARPLLVLLNKQDSKSCVDADQFQSCVKVSTLAEEYSMPLRILPVCIREKHLMMNVARRRQLCSKNLEEGLLWMVRCIETHFPILHMKVQQDTRIQIARDEQLRRDRTARLKAARDAAQEEETEADENSSDFIGSNPFIPLDQHLQRVERRKSSVVPATLEITKLVLVSSSLSLSRSEPNISRLSDQYASSDILMDPEVEGDSSRTDQRWHSSRNLSNFLPNGDFASGERGSIGNISELEEPTLSPRLKTSRPPVYKRLAKIDFQKALKNF